MNKNWILDLIAPIFVAILNVVSPQLRKIIVDFVKKLEVEAEKTPNKFDDELVELVKYLLVIK